MSPIRRRAGGITNGLGDDDNTADNNSQKHKIDDTGDSDLTISDRKRRRSSARVREIPNYNVTNKQRLPSTPTSSASSKSKKLIDPNEIVLDSDEIPSCFKQSPSNHRVSKTSSNVKKNSNIEQQAILKNNLADIITAQNPLVQEYYHLTNFTSLVYYKPDEPKQPENFDSFLDSHSLWPKIDQETLGRRSRRVVEHSDPLRMEVEKILELRKKEATQRQKLELQRLKALEESKIKKEEVIKVEEESDEEQGEDIEDEKQNQIVKSKGSNYAKKSPTSAPKSPRQKKKAGKEKSIKQEEQELVEEEIMDESENESDYDSDISIPSFPPSVKLPKMIHFKFDVKPQVVTHPSHVTEPKFESLTDYLNSYKGTIEEPGRDLSVEEYNEYLESQVQLIKKIKAGIDSKLLRLDLEENVFRNVPAGAREPTMIKKNLQYNQNYYKQVSEPFRLRNDLTHHDHLVAHGVRSAKLIHDSRNSKMQKCRKIAGMIETHFKRLSQEEERNQREYEKKMIKLARETAKEVKKYWSRAAKAYEVLQQYERERERAVKSKEQLSKILDHSTKVLGAQLTKSSNTPEPNGVNSDEDEDGDEVNIDSDSQSEDENMSSSSVENEEEDNKERNIELQDDSKLTVEELREKYRGLENNTTLADSDDESESEDGEPASLFDLYEDNASADGAAESKPMSIVDQLTEEQRQNLLENESTDPILNEDEDSDDSMDDSDDSMADSDDESGSSEGEDDLEEENEENKKSVGLSSLFGNPVEESEDESIYSENNNDTPSSSPKEEPEEIQGTSIPDVPYPVLLRGNLRIYQKQGLNWMASLYNNGTNGILADEMGLGKTIQTISLISYLACEKNVWGPHLIVVPTSVMLNWEMEFKRFAPGFKVLTYYGSPQQRKEKRKGWNTPDTFHVCITSYQLVVQDQQVFKRKKWKYMILDEAHNIKNFRSQRWNALLNFNTEHRLLLTGTPLQNNIMELWSLLYFLMPSTKASQTMPDGFANLMDFQQWFGKPVDKIIQGGGYASIQDDGETKETVNKLHQVLRPYLLRRLKQDVEKQMPAKHEHIVYCRLSARQRLLYYGFMNRAQTKESLASGNYLSIINCLMQLRKVCNHPDLFEVRPILTSFSMNKSVASNFEIKELIVRKNLRQFDVEKVDLQFLNLLPVNNLKFNSFHVDSLRKISASNMFKKQCSEIQENMKPVEPNFSDLEKFYEYLSYKEQSDLLDLFKQRLYTNDQNCNKEQMYSSNLIELLTIDRYSKQDWNQLEELKIVKSIETRASDMYDSIDKYSFITPKAVTQDMIDLTLPSELQQQLRNSKQITNPFHHSQIKMSITFPDKSLLQYDCGKLQRLATLLQDIIPKGHRVLIFTQMTKVLDILEKFMNYNGYKYMRLDGATKIEDRQLLTERFNKDTKIKCFILSTRSGGLGINLTGADTVIFYDSDWNPAMDKQCQDRCHRIGQTRDVHIYRFVTESTIESNILLKANQKRQLDNVIIQDGDFTTDYFSKITVQDMIGQDIGESGNKLLMGSGSSSEFSKVLEQAEDVEDAKAAKVALKEANIDNEDFDEDGKSTSNGDLNNDVSGRSTVEPGENGNGQTNVDKKEVEYDDEDYEDDDGGTEHIERYMLRFISNGFYYD